MRRPDPDARTSVRRPRPRCHHARQGLVVEATVDEPSFRRGVREGPFTCGRESPLAKDLRVRCTALGRRRQPSSRVPRRDTIDCAAFDRELPASATWKISVPKASSGGSRRARPADGSWASHRSPCRITSRAAETPAPSDRRTGARWRSSLSRAAFGEHDLGDSRHGIPTHPVVAVRTEESSSLRACPRTGTVLAGH